MEPALAQYSKKITTLGQMREDISEFESPVYVACVDPPFKPSFFKKNGINGSAALKYFWVFPEHRKLLDNTTFSAIDFYMNMTHQLGSDWQIYL